MSESFLDSNKKQYIWPNFFFHIQKCLWSKAIRIREHHLEQFMGKILCLIWTNQDPSTYLPIFTNPFSCNVQLNPFCNKIYIPSFFSTAKKKRNYRNSIDTRHTKHIRLLNRQFSATLCQDILRAKLSLTMSLCKRKKKKISIFPFHQM